MVKRGYVQVSVDALGTGASEGGWELFGEEEQIGFADMVDWVHQQEWSDGKLGVAGVSYMAISSLFAAQRRPDSIDAIFASLPLGDALRGIVGSGGLMNAHFLRSWMMITQTLSTQNIPAMLAYPQQMNQFMRSTQEHVEQIDSYFLPLVDDALWNEPYVSYDGEFWQTRSPLQNIDKIKAPTFILGGLDDLFQRDEPLLYERLKQNGVDTKLVIYNGFHAPNFVLSHVGNDLVPPIDFLMLQWFDHYLKGLETGTDRIPAVVQHVKNYPTKSTPEQFRNDSFITTTEWPHPEASAERWYLHGDLSLSRDAPNEEIAGPVLTEPPAPIVRAYRNEALLAVDYVISDGTKCSRSFEQWILGLAIPKNCFYSTDNSKQQRILFESEPMEEDYYINGPVQADIWIESTVTDAVVAIQIEEVSNRNAQPITNGQLLASMRAVDEERSRFLDGEMIQPFHYLAEERESLLVPGEVVKMQIEIFPTSAIIRKGNRLRISISPSNQAQGMLNYPRQARTENGITTIHVSPDYPSSVVFSVVPTSTLN
ncbi:MAG TPA: CocE/NonD family hydrolase [Dongiaceae bacterium]|nr:CocE/NonD family hydrolase [Dongiaceae bacterium]